MGFEVVLVVVHDGSILLFIGLVQDDVHGFDDIVLHSLGVAHGTIQLIHCLASLPNTSLVLFLELLDDPALEFVDDFIELTVVFLYFCLLFLQSLMGAIDLHV